MQIRSSRLKQYDSILRDYYGWIGYNESIFKMYPELIEMKKLCLEILRRDGNALRYIPEEKRTKKMCRAAVENYGWALIDVPQKFLIRKICSLAVKDDGIVWPMVPEKYQTEALALCAVRSNPISFQHMKGSIKTPLVCKRAVAQHTRNEEYVPQKVAEKIYWRGFRSASIDGGD